MDYDKLDTSRYDQARELPAETLALWADAIRESVPPAGVSTVIDLGCGTGRFTQLLAGVYDARIIGIDPSQKMLAQAASFSDSQIRLMQGSAESIPLPNHSADLIFLSMVWHHVEETAKALAEFQRVLKRPGHIILRAVTRETIEDNEFNVFFPEALEFDRTRTQSRPQIRETFERAGFKTVSERVVTQKFAGDPATYCEKIGMRCLSSLQVISDEAFERGMEALRRYCNTLPPDHPIFETIDLFAFTLESLPASGSR